MAAGQEAGDSWYKALYVREKLKTTVNFEQELRAHCPPAVN